MGVRVIGSDTGNSKRFQRITKPIESGDGTSSTVELGTTPGEHESHSTDNRIEPNTDGAIDPSSISADSGSGNASGDAPYGYTKFGRVRNRPVGSSPRGERTASTSKTTDSLASLVCMLHGVVSNIVKVDAFKISLEQSRELTAAALQVSELYDVPLPTEKVAAWMNLGAVAYKVYIVSDKKLSKIQIVSKAQEMPVHDFMVQ